MSGMTKLTRRQALHALVVAGAGSLLAACQPKVVEKIMQETVPVKQTVQVERTVVQTVLPATPAPVEFTLCTHTFQAWIDFHARQIGYYTEQHPNVKIEHVQYPQMEMVQKLVVGWSAGTAEDLIGAFGPWLPTLVKGEYIAPASDEVVQFLKEDFYQPQIDGGTFDGTIYTIPKEVGTPLPMYNRTIWEQMGVKDDAQYPVTHEDLVAVLPQFDKLDGIMGYCCWSSGIFAIIDWVTILMGYGGSILDEDLTKATFNNDVGLQVTKLWKQMNRSDGDASVFSAGKGATTWLGSWWKPTFADRNMPVKVGPPLKGPVRRVHANYQWDWCVSRASADPKKKAAWDYAMFISKPAALVDAWHIVGTAPFTKSAFQDPILANDEFLLSFNKYIGETENYYTKSLAQNEVETVIIQGLERLIAGELTEKDFLARAEEDVNTALANA